MGLTLKPQIQQHNLRQQVLEILKTRLISGKLASGEIYSAAALAAELGVSNSPVREAMLTLVNQGLMETVRNRGFRVIPIRRKQLEDIYSVRLLLEIPSIRKLATIPDEVRKVEPELRAKLADLRRHADQDDIVAYLTVDKGFHLQLLGILNNPCLVSTVETLRDQVRQYGVGGVSAQTILSRSATEHEDILEAILAGDAPKAAELMTSHIYQLIEDWSGTISKQAS
ncbi:GntR family transcriptional regulator [Rhizobium multihospitium]|uniref:DNA-binding transcriptional regulator, GntR family n=1 Tax=Rhizobium multihospitium TaxID=410764 RepID=A0A1C3VXJ2_9HYPH|nr:GntR family transcriptional regulator [Rhizobium multihospitium]SCB32304.1 DNA-binding transcriptional regulator, GntR family [Rhizobium multihospitium]